MLATDLLIERSLGLIHAKTQCGGAGLELTVRSVAKIVTGGSLDFGGSEYRPAVTSPTLSEEAADDKYGWWRLSEGLYHLHFNESLQLQPQELGIVTPHPRLLEAGATHAAVVLAPGEPLSVLLQVFATGLSLKENCRVSRLNVLA